MALVQQKQGEFPIPKELQSEGFLDRAITIPKCLSERMSELAAHR